MKTVLTIVFSLTVSAQSLSNEGWDFFDTDTQEFILDSVYDVQRIYFIEALELDPFQHNAQVDVNGDGIEVPPQMVKKFFSLLIEHRELFEHLKADAFHFFMKKMLPGSSDSQISVLLYTLKLSAYIHDLHKGTKTLRFSSREALHHAHEQYTKPADKTWKHLLDKKFKGSKRARDSETESVEIRKRLAKVERLDILNAYYLTY